MPALNFQARFARQVERGEKRQTIRARRKDGRDPKVGDRLSLYTGMRTQQCRKLGEAIVVAVARIRLDADAEYGLEVWRDDVRLTWRARLMFARADGFGTPHALLAWFADTHGLPFEGLLIRWRLA